MRTLHPAPGTGRTLGPRVSGGSVEFGVLAPGATCVELCLFEPDGERFRETARGVLPGRAPDGTHHGVIDGGPGLVYGLRAHGPEQDPSRVLLDPWAPRVVGCMDWERPDGVPRGVVVDHAFDWAASTPPRREWRESLIYEAHVKGLTQTHPDVPEPLRGTYLGAAHPAVVEHLVALGVTALELLPIQASVTEHRLQRLGLTNYWGYGTLGYFAPDPRFASRPGDEVREVQALVRALHEAGIEVLLDVVYNHTIEGRPEEPDLSLRGLDGDAWYRRDAHGRSVDWTGCGNTLDLGRDPALRLVLDSMRHWRTHYRIDGFRFDLAPALFREGPDGCFRPDGRFAAAVAQDPVLAGARLVAEPWDLGPDGYRLGQHPKRFAEWNDRFRDATRRFWRGEPDVRGELASRLAGSADLFERPSRSVNYVACHDGFPVQDLVTWDRKHNAANGEDNRDGSDANLSRSWGGEGPTDDPARRELRSRVALSLVATPLLALGVPMLGHGDELGRTQGGNNNVYCQDNPLAWIDWPGADRERIRFVARVVRARARLPQLRGRDFLRPEEARWLRPDGAPMEAEDWARPGHLLVLHLTRPDAVLVLNGGGCAVSLALPAGPWECVLDAAAPDASPRRCESTWEAQPHAVSVFLRPDP